MFTGGAIWVLTHGRLSAMTMASSCVHAMIHPETMSLSLPFPLPLPVPFLFLSPSSSFSPASFASPSASLGLIVQTILPNPLLSGSIEHNLETRHTPPAAFLRSAARLPITFSQLHLDELHGCGHGSRFDFHQKHGPGFGNRCCPGLTQ